MEDAESALTAVEVYVSDHGGEIIMSTDFQSFLGEKVIFWQTAPHATPNYNGLVERSIQSVKAMMQVLHIQSQKATLTGPLQQRLRKCCTTES